MADSTRVPLPTIAARWARIGVTGFGGPPAHIALLRRLCVERERWLETDEFEDALAAANLLPGPASTQMAIFCAWRVGAAPGAIIGGLGFILPGLALILGLSALYLSARPPAAVAGAALGAGATVAAVALQAAIGLMPASRHRIGSAHGEQGRWFAYAVAGATAAVLVGPYLVVVLLGCGLVEVTVRHQWRAPRRAAVFFIGTVATTGGGSLLSLAWLAFTVGALSYGGGFVIVPLMQHSVVSTYHFMTGPEFLGAVALGQVTPGPVVLTVAVVGYSVAGVGGGLLATAVAFTPSFLFVLVGGRHFAKLRLNERVQGFLTGAGPAAIGAIAGSAIPLALAIAHLWQLGVLAAALVWLLLLRRGVVTAIVVGGVIGAVLVSIGLPGGR